MPNRHKPQLIRCAFAGQCESRRWHRRSFAVLSRLLAAVGVAALPAALFRVRLLHVLRGLLLATRGFDRCPVFDYDSALRDHSYFDKLYGSGPGCRRNRFPMRRKITWL